MRMRNFHIITMVLSLVSPLCSSFVTKCDEPPFNEYILKLARAKCQLCPDGTFMPPLTPPLDHRHRDCVRCTQIQDDTLEVLVKPCTATEDTVIHCVTGYYRKRPSNPREKDRCEKCTECAQPIAPCQKYTDTQCCSEDLDVVYPDENGDLVCWKTPWMCRKGHYFDKSSHKCQPCPRDSFMSVDYHSMTKCWPCQTPSKPYHLPKHAEVISPCNSTHPPIIGCQDGFYRGHFLGINDEYIGCLPCTVCDHTKGLYMGRKCDTHHNTVCCPQPNMKVTDTLEGPHCELDTTNKFSDIKTDSTGNQKPDLDKDTRQTNAKYCKSTEDAHASMNIKRFSITEVIGIVVVSLVLVITCTFGYIFIWDIRLFKMNTAQSKDGQGIFADERSTQEVSFEDDSVTKVESLVKGFKLSDSDYRDVMRLLNEEMNKGLKSDTHHAADVKMFPTFVRSLPDGSETGEFLAVDLGGINLNALYIRLGGDGIDDIQSKTFLIPKRVKSGTGTELFDYIADSIGKFIAECDLMDHKLPLGFAISFACKYESLSTARLTKWTKGFLCEDVIGEDVCQLLREALERRTTCNVEIVAVVNDIVATLMSAAYNDIHCEIGLALGVGCNACYLEDLDKVHTWACDKEDDDNQPKQVIINTEWGAFGENGCLDFMRTEYDIEMDKRSENPGKQILEKMICSSYMGEIIRLVLVKLTQMGQLFQTVDHDNALHEKGKFYAKYVSEIESDDDEFYRQTQQVLDELHMQNYTLEDCKLVKYVTTLVFERSAFLCAAGLATLMNRLNQPDITVVVDGLLYKCHARLQELITEKLQELVTPGIQFQLCETGDGNTNAIGAALTAAVALRLRQSVAHTH